MKVDAHHHLWNLTKTEYPWLTSELAVIYRTFEAAELEPLMQAAGINKTIIVQAMNSYDDTDYMLQAAADFAWIGGVVGWVPLDQPSEAKRQLTVYAKNPLFKGVRHIVSLENDPDWIIRDEVIVGLKVLASFGMSFDFVAEFPNHLKHVPELSRLVPELKIVIDHLAKPPIKTKQWEPWASQLAESAKNPNVYAKISGLNTAASEQWSATEIKPYIDYAIKCFSAERIMFGSDWPVSLLAGKYDQVWNETIKALIGYSEADKDAILGGTAAEFYRL